MKKFVILFGGAALLAACQTNPPAPPAPPPVAVDPNNPLMAPGYIATAGSSEAPSTSASPSAGMTVSNKTATVEERLMPRTVRSGVAGGIRANPRVGLVVAPGCNGGSTPRPVRRRESGPRRERAPS